MTSVTIQETQQRLSQLLAEALNGQVIEIVAPDGGAFRLVPVAAPRRADRRRIPAGPAIRTRAVAGE